MKSLYFEKQKTHFIVLLVYIVIAIFLLGLVLWPEFYQFSQTSLGIKILLLLVAVVDLFFFWTFSELKIKLTEDYFQFGFGRFKRKFRWQEIKNIEVKDLDRKKFLGYGIRLGAEKAIGFIARGPQGFWLTLKNNKRFYVTSAEPEKIKELSKRFI